MACGACAKRAAERRAAQAEGRTNRTIYAAPEPQGVRPSLGGFSRPRYQVARQDGDGDVLVFNTLAEAQKTQRDLGGDYVIRTLKAGQ